ncbi:MAG: DegV family protein [Anaerolineae bacterium]|nr:DegV family protein [Anaerolineae bacterium]
MIRIITDTLSGLSPQWAAEHGIPLIPQVIYFGEESFLEIQEMSIEEFIRRLKSSSVLPRTAAPPPGLFIKAFEELDAAHNTILCIHPTAELSGTVRSAQIAKAEAFPNADIRIIDTRTIGAQLGVLVQMADSWVREGLDADTIVRRLEELIPRLRTYFLVDTLEYLQRGGRIGGAAALVGQLLQIKPILTIRDGKVDVYARERTKKRGLERFREIILEEMDLSFSPCLVIQHCDARQEAEELVSFFRERLGRQDIPLFDVVPAIATHAGPGTLGASFFAKP